MLNNLLDISAAINLPGNVCCMAHFLIFYV